MKNQKKIGAGGGRVGGGGQCGCERRSKAFVKIQKKKNNWRGVGSGASGLGGGQGGCERNSEVFVTIQKSLLFFWGGGVGPGVRSGVGWGRGEQGLG